MNYQQLDAIADAYIPLLGLLVLGFIARQILNKQYRTAARFSLQTLVSVALVYALMALDNYFLIWPTVSLDYSTHTALSLALVMLLTQGSTFQVRWQVALGVSFLAYAILMLYQQYHTIADIVSTAFILVPSLFIINRKLVSKDPNWEHCSAKPYKSS